MRPPSESDSGERDAWETNTRAEQSSRTRPDADRGDRDSEGPRRKRKKRETLNCAECRRLKLKCDRQVPCSNCVRRHCVDLCPDGTRPVQRSTDEALELRGRLDALERLLSTNGIAVPRQQGESANTTMTPPRRQRSSSPSRRRSRSPASPHATRYSPNSRMHSSTPRPSSAARTTQVDRHRESPHDVASVLVDAAALEHDLRQGRQQASSSTQGGSQAGLQGQVDTQAPQQSAVDTDTSLPLFEPPMPITIEPQVRFDFSQPASSGDAVHPLANQLSVAANTPSANPQRHQAIDIGVSPEEQSFGTLVISQSGRSKYLGHTAASEWLKDQEIQDSGSNDSRGPSRAPSPVLLNRPQKASKGEFGLAGFPFGPALQPVTMEFLLSKLPPLDLAMVCVDSYYRYFAWHFDVAPRPSFQPLFDRVYSFIQQPTDSCPVSPQELALVYVILAMGALHNLELPPNDPMAEEFLTLAKSSLALGKFLVHNTLAGVQTLHIMAHCSLETERGRSGDVSWPIWGIAMRLIQAMGLHRDGSIWNLTPEVTEERRRVFWECQAADIFQANCFSRPSSIHSDYFDTAFPSEIHHSELEGFGTLKFKLSQIACSVLDFAMKVRAPPYSTVNALHERLCEFERQVPYHLRCRAVLLALTSRYDNPEDAIRDSPEETKRDVARTFEQFTLALNITETFLCLHRPYFVRALHERVEDPVRSALAQSYLTVVERCNVIIQIVSRLHALHPNVCARHWYLWYHTFNAAVCIGTLILVNPKNPLAAFALAQIDAAIGLYTAAVQGKPSRRKLHNFQWLLRLRQKAHLRMTEAATGGPLGSGTGSGTNIAGGPTTPMDAEGDEDVELLGWRTRLIRRGARTQTATTIASASPFNSAASVSPDAAVAETVTQALQQHFGPGTGGTDDSDGMDVLGGMLRDAPLSSSTDAFMHQFWDPMLLQDAGTNALGWLDWEFPSQGQGNA